MARINAAYLFAEKKKNTNPFVKIPRNIKESLNIDKVHSNGIFKIEPGNGLVMYDRCYIFEDVNYRNLDKDEKTSTLLELVTLFRSMDYQFKITIANEQQDMKKFVEDVFNPVHGEEYPLIQEGIGCWLNQKIEEGTRDIRRVLYLTVTCKAKSFEEAKVYFGTLDTTLQTIFESLKSRLYVMSGEERLLVLQKILRLGSGGIQPKLTDNIENTSWKNQILPARFDSEEDSLHINDKYACVLFAHDYDIGLDEEKVIHGLTDTLFPTYITLDFQPVSRRILKDKLMNSHRNNERNIAQETEKKQKNNQHATISYELSKKRNEIEGLVDQIEGNDEEGLFLGMLVIVQADSMSELEERVDTLVQIASTNGYTLDPYYHRQRKAFMTALPIGGRQVNHMRALLTTSAVAWQPFYSKDLIQPGGTILGINRTTKRLIVVNCKLLKAPHGFIVGHTGSGKSFFIKETEIAQTLLFTDDNILILDPNNEQQLFINSIGGQYFDLTPQSKFYLNPFECPREVWDGDKIQKDRFVAQKKQFAGALCTSTMINMVVTQVHLNFIKKAVQTMYDSYFERNNFSKQKTLKDMRDCLLSQITEGTYTEDERMILDICNCIQEFVEGTYDMFAHPSNINIKNRCVGFGMQNIPTEATETIMLTLMHIISMQLDYNQGNLRASRFIIDEAQVLCKNPIISSQLLYAIETYRKRGGIVTLALQNLKRAVENPEIRDMLSNCPRKIFFDSGGVDALALADIQELSEAELRSLENPEKGLGLVVWEGQVFMIDARMDKVNPLYEMFNTDFHEKAAQHKEEEAIANGYYIELRMKELLEVTNIPMYKLFDMCEADYTEKEILEVYERMKSEGIIVERNGICSLKK